MYIHKSQICAKPYNSNATMQEQTGFFNRLLRTSSKQHATQDRSIYISFLCQVMLRSETIEAAGWIAIPVKQFDVNQIFLSLFFSLSFSISIYIYVYIFIYIYVCICVCSVGVGT